MTVAPQPLASRETVLIIEDHEDHLEISRTVLQDDYRVVWATTAAEGKRKALEENPSLVLVDLSLPDQDGTTLVAALKAEPRLRGVPMLAFTARNQPSDKLEAFDIGFDGYLAKPVRPAQLLESVAVHLARRKVRGRSRVLLGEQNETSARVLSEHLSRLDLEVLSARNGEEALRFLQAGEIDLLLVNTDLPGHSGYDLCRLQKGEQAGAFRPVILFSSGYNQNSMNRAFEAGADDYLVNPKSMEELSSRVTALLRLQELTSTLSRLNGEIKEKSDALRTANEDLQLKTERLEVALKSEKLVLEELQGRARKLRTLSITDELTGLYNPRHFGERLAAEFDRTRRHGKPLSVIMIDVNAFKSINDVYGHPVGDLCLKFVAERILRSIRTSDLAARYGGDEFVVCLPETEVAGARVFAERFVKEVSREPFRSRELELAISVSVGVAMVTPGVESPSELIERADLAMYHAKKTGKGVVGYLEDEVSSPDGRIAPGELALILRQLQTSARRTFMSKLLGLLEPPGRQTERSGLPYPLVAKLLDSAVQKGSVDSDFREILFSAFILFSLGIGRGEGAGKHLPLTVLEGVTLLQEERGLLEGIDGDVVAGDAGRRIIALLVDCQRRLDGQAHVSSHCFVERYADVFPSEDLKAFLAEVEGLARTGT